MLGCDNTIQSTTVISFPILLNIKLKNLLNECHE